MKALIVSYCPRQERSRTKQLADYCARLLKSKGVVVDLLDLVKDVPDLLMPERLAAYYNRNYVGQKLDAREQEQLKKMDRMTAQLKGADVVVLAYPMYNFSQPAVVKAWFDSVMQKGETWDIAQGGYAGLMKARKALIVSSSGGAYDGDLSGLDHSSTLSKQLFEFMGYRTAVVSAAGINRYPEKEAEILSAARVQIETALAGFTG